MGPVDKFIDRVTAFKTIILDTNAVIYFLEGIPEYCEFLMPLFEKAENNQLKIILSVITEAELLVKPYRENDVEAIKAIRMLIEDFPNIEVVPVTREIARKAAEIRSKSGLKLPDAIIVSTGMLFSGAMVGNDSGLIGKLDDYLPYIMLGENHSSEH
ncbi:MAG: PIN domain-containing protein [Peptococcaceae bacterium]|nr:PIN domain-containing protein [Peptococcaceae bacterium]